MIGKLGRRLRKVRSDERGAAAVEFGLVSSAFILFMFVLINAAISTFHYVSLHWAVERGARAASLSNTITTAQVSTVVNGYLTSVSAPAAVVVLSTATVGGVSVATVTATFQKVYTVPFLSPVTINFSAATSTPQNI